MGAALPTLTSAIKNEYTKQILRRAGLRPSSLQQRKTAHYRMPMLEKAGGYMVLNKYKGPEIPSSEWEDLTYTTYASDPTTYFAPIASATGEIELKGFWEYGKADLDGEWTENAKKCPTLVTWDGWRAIDEHETGLGAPAGRPRVKLVRTGEMLDIASGALR